MGVRGQWHVRDGRSAWWPVRPLSSWWSRGSGCGGSSSATTRPRRPTSRPPAWDVDGSWTVDTSVGTFDDFTGTWAGYRVEEELARIGSHTAVGRTPDVTGTMTVEGGQVTGVDVQVDLTTLKSDSGTRDGALSSRGLESERFPTATFTLSQPLTVPEGVADGQQASTRATGELTIHGVTKEVTVDIDTKLSNGKAAVVGNAPVTLTDFGIEPPTGFSVVSIKDEGAFEFQIFFAKQ